MQKSTFFKEKIVLRVDFIKLTFRWLPTGLSDLKKHQTIEMLLMVNLYAFFECCIFSKLFEIFEIHQYFLVKFLNALNFI